MTRLDPKRRMIIGVVAAVGLAGSASALATTGAAAVIITTPAPTNTAPTISGPATTSPTKAPITTAPTRAPITTAPTKAPITTAPTKAPITTAPITKAPVTKTPHHTAPHQHVPHEHIRHSPRHTAPHSRVPHERLPHTSSALKDIAAFTATFGAPVRRPGTPISRSDVDRVRLANALPPPDHLSAPVVVGAATLLLIGFLVHPFRKARRRRTAPAGIPLMALPDAPLVFPPLISLGDLPAALQNPPSPVTVGSDDHRVFVPLHDIAMLISSSA